MNSKHLHTLIVFLVITGILAPLAMAGNKKIMTTRAAQVLAERALIESVYGLKVRSSEEVQDLVAANFIGKTETKTSATIGGIKIEDVVYDDKKDVAKATASLELDQIVNIDGKTVNLKNKTFRRVAFATSTPSQAGPLQALRAAEIDGYKQLVKRVVGFTLDSQTTVENYILTSDVVKAKVLATVYLAEVTEFGWEESGNAFVKMVINVKEVGDLLGQTIVGEDDMLEIRGAGAQVDDFMEKS